MSVSRGQVAGSMRRTIDNLREANAGLMAQLTSAQNLAQEWQDRCLAMQTERDSARHMHEATVALLDQGDALRTRVDAVLALHQRQKMMTAGCVRCIECGAEWPCPTRRALEGKP